MQNSQCKFITAYNRKEIAVPWLPGGIQSVASPHEVFWSNGTVAGGHCVPSSYHVYLESRNRILKYFRRYLTLNPLTWKIWWAPNNASKWQMWFNSAFKGLSLHNVLICEQKKIAPPPIYIPNLDPQNTERRYYINPLKPELNPICYLLALLGNHHFLHVSRIRVKSLTLRRLMSYIYGAPILDVSRSHTTTQHSR